MVLLWHSAYGIYCIVGMGYRIESFSDMGKCNGIFIMDSHQQVGVLQ
jgi:hypothetical protein